MPISLGQIELHNRQFLRQRGRLRVHCAQAVTFLCARGQEWHQLCQVGFLGTDCSIYLVSPYLPDCPGLVAEVTSPALQTGAKVDLSEIAYVTSHSVKYSHHASGLALFSQDGRVKSIV